MFFDIELQDQGEPYYLQIYNRVKEMILTGMLPSGSKLPSSRELAAILKVSRVTVINAFQKLEEKNYIYTINGKGTFVSETSVTTKCDWKVDWSGKVSQYALEAESLDIMKHELLYRKGMISFKSIAPDEKLFDMDEVKRSFQYLISVEGEKILNYGYARGYRPLIQWIMEYMHRKGVDTSNKSVLITNGFTEGFDLILSSLMEKGDTILCENPTHNTAIKLMKLHGLKILGIRMTESGMDLKELDSALKINKAKAAYIVPSYHNPTGIVMSFEKRKEIYEIFKYYGIPVIEDGFNEELQHLGSHIAPVAAVGGADNSIVYIGSFSKILFPGMRIGWIFADNRLIDLLESVKRSRNIHTSFLDQGILYQYLKSGSFEKYIKRVRTIYKEKYELTKSLVKTYIPNEWVYGDGGLYLFIRLKGICSRKLLEKCSLRGVIFTPGDIFYVDSTDLYTLRVGFSRTTLEDIEKGIRIIGEEALKLSVRHFE
ncbi:MAG: PLP-dependent aminotransferase family protein [Bacillota bacterium]|nr:PLP-dependent aminotransferase family protein [Bacillota bacterium]